MSAPTTTTEPIAADAANAMTTLLATLKQDFVGARKFIADLDDDDQVNAAFNKVVQIARKACLVDQVNAVIDYVKEIINGENGFLRLLKLDPAIEEGLIALLNVTEQELADKIANVPAEVEKAFCSCW